ncbi:DUF3365 domain-containing protein [Prolixibacteraceae bacterium Z1-6]|uniref:DUF3365 domain-containing protein n=1 Tax=Draconibacterium aestuarii TaxID=2998507 RepID=A0A9X3F9C5_9BACT|nr:DUF3365 domain-containing protein [Prolixibacteraceae bacterium Z1-6]
MRLKSIHLVLFIFLLGCSTKIDSGTYAGIQQKGREVSAVAQTTLLKNVGSAIQKGGPQYAVEFCNLEAADIIGNINAQYNCTISRVSAKNRNPNNALVSEQEKTLWMIFQQTELTDTVIRGNKQQLVYYKTIKIGMPVCLKCHGNPESDINTPTLQKLHELYPNDQATGYQINDFRGLWKIEFRND